MDFVNNFLPDLAAQLLEYMRINNLTIKLIDNQQLPYKFIFKLKLMELKTLKTYIDTNLANCFKKSFNSPTIAYTNFVKKSDKNFQL